MNFARIFACLTPVFLLTKRLSFARLFTKMNPSEELGTLVMESQVGWNVGHNLSIGGRELPYSGTHLKGIVTDVQVSKFPISKSHFVLKKIF